MEDYKGDSPSKKWARFIVWSRIMDMAGPRRFQEGKHLILASWEAGDVSTLMALGVPPKNIIAVEKDSKSAYLAQEKYPEIRVMCGDAVKIAKEYKRTLTSAYLDYCNTVSRSMVMGLQQIIQHGLKDEAFLAVTVQAGREKGEAFKEIEATQNRLVKTMDRHMAQPDEKLLQLYYDIAKNTLRRVELRDEIEAALESGDAVEMKRVADQIRAAHTGMDRTTNVATRIRHIGDHLKTGLLPFRTCLYITDFCEYVSATDDSKGVPMGVGVFRSFRMSKSLTLNAFKEKSWKIALKDGHVREHDCNRTEAQLRDEIFDLDDFLTKDHEDSKTTETDYRWQRDNVPMLFNIPKETVAAWRAHRTRGTYENERR